MFSEEHYLDSTTKAGAAKAPNPVIACTRRPVERRVAEKESLCLVVCHTLLPSEGVFSAPTNFFFPYFALYSEEHPEVELPWQMQTQRQTGTWKRTRQLLSPARNRPERTSRLRDSL